MKGILCFLLIALSTRGLAQTQVAQLTAHDPSVQDYFGNAAVSASWIIVGAHRDSDFAPGCGSAYFFQESGGTWIERQKIHASDPTLCARFGNSVALSGQTAVIGAPCALDPTGSFAAGAAYVFEYQESNGQWLERSRLAPLDLTAGDMFGNIAVLDQATILASSSDDDNNRGSAYVFTRSGTSWSEETKLIGSDTAPGDRFGSSLAIRGDLAVVGAPLQPDPTLRGAAYVFSRIGTTWHEDAKLVSSDLDNFDNFGMSVAIEGSQIVIGASRDNGNQGSFYLFERIGNVWTEIQKYVSPTALSDGFFGISLDLDGEFLLVGASNERSLGVRTGVGHLYRKAGSLWSYWARLEAMPPVFGANRGIVVGIDRETIVLGAPREDHSGIMGAGAAWVFDAIDSTPSSYCSAKTTSRSCLPFMTSTGEPSASNGAFFVQSNDHVEGQAGLLLYGFKKGSLGFHGGTLCVKTPFQRLSTLVKATDGVLCTTCAGNCRTLSRNFNQYVQGGQDPMLTAGQRVNLQWRQRDPNDPLGFGDNLSDGLSFVIGL